ncbi:hypothetical protein JK182_09820 [Acetobacter okinawensis]|uniref:hypothetical protein n=1 Tax=Acetobacter okinawensis TaxID=1076594 RepID=UPI001BA52688|nr:hypothetical protein [Acetobacter okinawensis]MBS0988957.1 hypothetical protein [Acetobacter okinawensis]
MVIANIEEAERRAEQRVRAEIARDSERLDWLERIAPAISMVGDGWGNRDHWHLVFADISKGVPAEYIGDTIRQAIDAAREVG